MASVALTPEAYADLDRLAAFLEGTEAATAEKAMKRILTGFRALRLHPRLGRPAAHGLRELVLSVGKAGYVALYRFAPASDAVLILRVRHQREAGYPSL